MADFTNIEWCDATLNLWWGCTKVSDGCKFCYAEHLADHRYNKGNWGPSGTRREVKSWRANLTKISNRAKAEGRRLKVFCQSMSDTFEGPETMGGVGSENWRTVQELQDELASAIMEHPHLDFLLLTKRPENVFEVLTRNNCVAPDECTAGNFTFPDNCWIGTSVEDQKTAEKRIPHLLRCPAAVRFLSCEPLIGGVSLFARLQTRTQFEEGLCAAIPAFGITPEESRIALSKFDLERRPDGGPGIDWVICGGESGPNARPMHPDWARSLRDQCQAAGVPFFFKQWGEFQDGSKPSTFCYTVLSNGRRCLTERENHQQLLRELGGWDEFNPTLMSKVGKAKAGRLLDGREWNQFPEVKQ